jgi:hypothetical protein
MTDPIEQCLHNILADLKRSIMQLNSPANLDGLLAAHFDVSSRLGHEIGWQVYCDPAEWVQQHMASLDEAPELAILGCLLSEQVRRLGDAGSHTASLFESSVSRLQQRRDIFQSPNSWIWQPHVVVGVALGVRSVAAPPFTVWMQTLLQEGIRRKDAPLFPRLTYVYALALLGASLSESPSGIAVVPRGCSVAELALAIWLVRREVPGIAIQDRGRWLDEAQQTLVSRLLTEAPYEAQDYKAALIWEVAVDYIEAKSAYPTGDHVTLFLQRFPAALERWRSKKWVVEDEYDIQAMLWLILRPHFDDLRYEEYLPKLGRSAERYDIGIPQLGLIVEAKYARQASDFQRIVEEIGKDAAQLQPQSTFTGILVFVYDESCSGEQHDWARQAMEKFAPVRKAIIVSAPSTCRRPAMEQPRRRRRNAGKDV